MSLLVRDVIKRAMRMQGALASGADPNADEATDYLLALNTMKRAMFGTLIGPRLSPQSVTGASGQAERGGLYQVNVAAAFALSAPATPRAGSRFGVADAGFSFLTYPCSVLGNGQLINGVTTAYVMNVNGQSARFWFRADTGNWILEADYVAITDPIEFPDPLIAARRAPVARRAWSARRRLTI